MKDKIALQREKIQAGNPEIFIHSACKLEDGILQLSQAEKHQYLKDFTEKRQELDISFFIPASGSGSRMFSALFEVNHDESPDEKSVQFVNTFIDELEYLPFFDAELAKLKDDYKTGRINRSKVLDYVLHKYEDQGLALASKPKGLIPFHQYEDRVLNPFQEHLLQGQEIAGEEAGFHFTINSQFETEINETLKAMCDHHQTSFKFEFSEQNPATNAIAFKENLEPLYDNSGNIVTRPAGHGTLIHNLNELDADLVFIRNIDNMQHYRKAETSLKTRKILAGVLLDFKEQVDNILSKIERSHAFESSLSTLNKKYDLRLSEKQLLDSSHAFAALNRPIRICGMVKNEGQPGGGPFWVQDESGNLSRQIIEKSQIEGNPKSMQIMNYATHFNPVELFCSVRDYKGRKFDLKDFVDEDQYFVVNKTQDGEKIVYIEQPGLWNGAMANWLTLFYEIDSNCFSPVKTVLDLLNNAHKA